MKAVQKRLVSMAAMLAIAGAVGAFAYFGTFKTKQKEEEEKLKDEKVASFSKAEEVKELTLVSKGTTFKLIGDGEGERTWRLTEPLATPAERQAVDSVLAHFAEMKRKRAFDAQPTDLKSFGLDPALATVAVKLKDGKEESFKIGKKNSFDDNVYLQRGSDAKVSMVPSTVSGFADKDLFALREKRLAIFEDKEVQSLAVELAGKPAYTLEKRGEEWFIKSPIEARAEKAQVTTLLSSLRYLRATKFATEALGDVKALATYGLDKPSLAVTVGVGEAKLRLLFATVNQKGEQKFGMIEGVKNPVLEVNEDLSKKYAIALNDLRDKLIASFERDQVSKVVVMDGEIKTELVKKKNDKQEDQWTFADGKETADGRVASLLWRLSSLRGKQIVTDKVDPAAKSNAGLEPQRRSVTLFDAEGKMLASYVFGADKDEAVYMYADAGKRIDLVDKTSTSEVKFEASHYEKEPATAAGKGVEGATPAPSEAN
jgi:hypothetical protein